MLLNGPFRKKKEKKKREKQFDFLKNFLFNKAVLGRFMLQPLV